MKSTEKIPAPTSMSDVEIAKDYYESKEVKIEYVDNSDRVNYYPRNFDLCDFPDYIPQDEVDFLSNQIITLFEKIFNRKLKKVEVELTLEDKK